MKLVLAPRWVSIENIEKGQQLKLVSFLITVIKYPDKST